MRRLLLAGAALMSFLGTGCSVESTPSSDEPPATEEKPALLLLSSLPILFGPAFPTNDEFSINDPPDVQENVLQKSLARWRLLGIATTAPEELARGELLLMAHPHAQAAENLVALDEWVRAGGRVLLLADPAFAIERGPATLGGSSPPPFFADTGLLGHWGLTLGGPLTRGAAQLQLVGQAVEVRSPGRFEATGDACTLEADGFLADCRLGKGRALLVADADFIIAKGAQGDANRAALNALIDRLRS